MQTIKQYDEYIKAIEADEDFDYTKIDNFDLFNAYYKSVHRDKNSVVDFCDVLWEDRVDELVDAMLSHGIRDFTLSSKRSNIQSVIVAFMNSGEGCYLIGMKDVFTGFTKFDGEREMAPAFMLHLVDVSKFDTDCED